MYKIYFKVFVFILRKKCASRCGRSDIQTMNQRYVFVFSFYIVNSFFSHFVFKSFQKKVTTSDSKTKIRLNFRMSCFLLSSVCYWKTSKYEKYIHGIVGKIKFKIWQNTQYNVYQLYNLKCSCTKTNSCHQKMDAYNHYFCTSLDRKRFYKRQMFL